MTLDDLQTIISSLLLKGYHGFSLGFSDSLNTYSARLWARPPAHTHLASPNDAHPVLLIGIGPSLQHALNDLLLREETGRGAVWSGSGSRGSGEWCRSRPD